MLSSLHILHSHFRWLPKHVGIGAFIPRINAAIWAFEYVALTGDNKQYVITEFGNVTKWELRMQCDCYELGFASFHIWTQRNLPCFWLYFEYYLDTGGNCSILETIFAIRTHNVDGIDVFQIRNRVWNHLKTERRSIRRNGAGQPPRFTLSRIFSGFFSRVQFHSICIWIQMQTSGLLPDDSISIT